MEQIERLKAEGASEQELNDPAVADLALRKVFEEHFDDIRIDPDLTDETFATVSNQASPEGLREIAAQARKEGNSRIGSYLEPIPAIARDSHYNVGRSDPFVLAIGCRACLHFTISIWPIAEKNR